MADRRFHTIAIRFLRAFGRLQTAYVALYPPALTEFGRTYALEEVWAELHETLGWLYTLSLRREMNAVIDPDLMKALTFIRGLVHHHFSDAIELRDNVELPLGPTSPAKSILIQDWCWLEPARLSGLSRSSNAKSRTATGQTAYETRLANRAVRGALDEVAAATAAILAT